jgi:outer membrane protein assembly factor BamB
VVSGFANGRLAALKLHDGRLLWESVIAVPKGRTELERLVDIDAQLEISGGVVYVATYQGRIAAVSLDGGRLLWGREFSSYSGIALAGRMLYVSDARGDLWALERNSGGTLWKQDALHGRGLSMPVLQGDAVVVGDYEGYLHWLDREDGHLLARARVEDWQAYYPIKDEFYNDNAYREDRMVLAAPRASGDWLYAVDKRGVLNAYQIRPLPAEG